jgi:hypothetical protein
LGCVGEARQQKKPSAHQKTLPAGARTLAWRRRRGGGAPAAAAASWDRSPAAGRCPGSHPFLSCSSWLRARWCRPWCCSMQRVRRARRCRLARWAAGLPPPHDDAQRLQVGEVQRSRRLPRPRSPRAGLRLLSVKRRGVFCRDVWRARGATRPHRINAQRKRKSTIQPCSHPPPHRSSARAAGRP